MPIRILQLHIDFTCHNIRVYILGTRNTKRSAFLLLVAHHIRRIRYENANDAKKWVYHYLEQKWNPETGVTLWQDPYNTQTCQPTSSNTKPVSDILFAYPF